MMAFCQLVENLILFLMSFRGTHTAMMEQILHFFPLKIEKL